MSAFRPWIFAVMDGPEAFVLGGEKSKKQKRKGGGREKKKARLELNAKQQLSRLIAPPE